MKSIAEFKRKAIIGSKWHTIYHREKFISQNEHERAIYELKDAGIGIVSEVLITQIAFNRNGIVSWLRFPIAKRFKSLSDISFQIVEEDYKTKELIPILTYTLVE